MHALLQEGSWGCNEGREGDGTCTVLGASWKDEILEQVIVGLVGFILGVKQRACEISAMVHELKSQMTD